METSDKETTKCLTELTSTDGFYYLASPYSHEDRNIISIRVHESERAIAWLTKQNVVVFGAIHHSHPLVKYGLTGDWECWKKIDTAFLKKSDGLIILDITGWTTSKGVKAELTYCGEMKKPIYLLKRKERYNESGYTISKISSY